MTVHPYSRPLPPDARCAVALGTFDGLHLGHQQVIGQVTKSEYTPTLLAVVPQVEPTSGWLIPPEEFAGQLSRLGIRRYVPIPLEEIRHLSPEQFFTTYLVEHLHAGMIACGFNFRFGKNAAGDIHLLNQLCREHNILLQVTQPVEHKGEPVSSTRIRQALSAGDPCLAQQLLGRPFGFTAPVQAGKRLGRTIGFPTINQAIPAHLFVPKLGVYGVTVTVDGQDYIGVCNIGCHPTVGNAKTPLAETYILDYQGDAYGKPVSIRLHHYLRPEQTFDSLTQLSDAIHHDANTARERIILR